VGGRSGCLGRAVVTLYFRSFTRILADQRGDTRLTNQNFEILNRFFQPLFKGCGRLPIKTLLPGQYQAVVAADHLVVKLDE
jgi:hypothetical protein